MSAEHIDQLCDALADIQAVLYADLRSCAARESLRQAQDAVRAAIYDLETEQMSQAQARREA